LQVKILFINILDIPLEKIDIQVKKSNNITRENNARIESKEEHKYPDHTSKVKDKTKDLEKKKVKTDKSKTKSKNFLFLLGDNILIFFKYRK